MDLSNLQFFPKQNITYLLSYLGALQGFILAIIVLYYPRQHNTSNRLLSLFIFVLAYLLLIARIVEIIDTPFLKLIYAIRFLAPIALYLYIKSLFQQLEWKKQTWHLLIIFLDLLMLYSLITVKVSTIGNEPIWNSFVLSFISWCWFLLVYTIYFVLIYKVLQQYKRKVLMNFSSINNIGLQWVHQVFVGFLCLIIIDILVASFSIGFPDFYSPYHGLINTITYTAFMYFVTIKGKLSPQIYKLQQLEDCPPPAPSSSDNIDEKEVKAQSEELLILSRKIIELIEEEQLYKEMGLSVNEVADKIGSQSYLVSQAINSCLGKNFFELINRYRVEEAKTLLKDPSKNHLSNVGIGFESGFNSKTSFNTCFKKYTGMTPSEFKNQIISIFVLLFL